MTSNSITVADRLKALEAAPPEANFTLTGIRLMYEGMGGTEFQCTISGYCRTQVFEFPRIHFSPEGEPPHHDIFASPTVKAFVTSDLMGHFVNSPGSHHYAISPSLRHEVNEIYEAHKSQQMGREAVFIVVEEYDRLAPVQMVKGECSIVDEVAVRDGQSEPILVGGREGEQFIIAWATVDGAWPVLPNNRQLVNMVLAGVRAGQETADPIRKYLDQECLVTDDGRFVEMLRPTMSARVTTTTPMDPTSLRNRATEIRDAISKMTHDISSPHLTLLVNSMYSDEHKDDAYRRLQYLGLWQSLADAGRRSLDYQGDIRDDQVVIAGNRTLKDLKEYRNAIAHWWTDSIDENFMADLHRTINELIRRKYF